MYVGQPYMPGHVALAWMAAAPLGPRRDLGFSKRQDPRDGWIIQRVLQRLALARSINLFITRIVHLFIGCIVRS